MYLILKSASYFNCTVRNVLASCIHYCCSNTAQDFSSSSSVAIVTHANPTSIYLHSSYSCIWSEWRLTVIAATVRIALVDILDLSEVDIPAGVFLHPAVGWG